MPAQDSIYRDNYEIIFIQYKVHDHDSREDSARENI